MRRVLLFLVAALLFTTGGARGAEDPLLKLALPAGVQAQSFVAEYQDFYEMLITGDVEMELVIETTELRVPMYEAPYGPERDVNVTAIREDSYDRYTTSTETLTFHGPAFCRKTRKTAIEGQIVDIDYWYEDGNAAFLMQHTDPVMNIIPQLSLIKNTRPIRSMPGYLRGDLRLMLFAPLTRFPGMPHNPVLELPAAVGQAEALVFALIPGQRTARYTFEFNRATQRLTTMVDRQVDNAGKVKVLGRASYIWGDGVTEPLIKEVIIERGDPDGEDHYTVDRYVFKKFEMRPRSKEKRSIARPCLFELPLTKPMLTVVVDGKPEDGLYPHLTMAQALLLYHEFAENKVLLPASELEKLAPQEL